MTENTIYAFHPACLCLPKMQDDEYTALRASVRNGYDPRHPILLHDGMILDGRHRYLACRDEGVTPIFAPWQGGDDPFKFVWTEHSARRSWVSQEQKVLVNRNISELSAKYQAEQQRIRDAANEKRSEAAKEQIAEQPRNELGQVVSRVTGQFDPTPGQRNHTEEESRRTRTAIAKTLDVAPAAVKRANYINDHSPELAQQVINGEIPASKAIQTIRKEKLALELKEVAAREVEQPTGLFDVIVIDPPWPMQKIDRNERPNQVAFEYPTMTEDELEALSIPADSDCHAWVWTTHKFMPMALRLIEKWGMKYVCTFVWHKPGGFQPIGLPQYNCEFALYARKGSPKFLDTKALPTCFQAPRGAHSEKPDEFYEIVRRVTGGRRLDMFNRRPIEGFATWGKEAA